MPDLINRVKDLYEAFARGDVPTLLASVADDVSWEVEAPAELAAAGIWRGRHEVAQFFMALAGQTADMKLEMTEFLAGDNTVAAFGRFQGTIKATGLPFDVPVAHFSRFRDGLIVRHVQVSNTAAITDAIRGNAVGAVG